MLNSLIILLSIGSFIVLRALMDYELIEVYKVDIKRPYKILTAALTMLFVSLLSKIGSENLLFIELPIIYGFGFDTCLNKLRGLNKEHLGTNKIDLFWSKIPFQWYVRFIISIILSLNICLQFISTSH